MTSPPTLLVRQIDAVGEANGGALVTLTVSDAQDRTLVIALPYAQAQAVLAPLTAALGVAHRRLLGAAGSEQALIDRHRVAGIDASAVEVARVETPGHPKRILLRVQQGQEPFLDLFLSDAIAQSLATSIEDTLEAAPRLRPH